MPMGLLSTATRITKCLFNDGARIYNSNLSRAFMASEFVGQGREGNKYVCD